MRLKTISILGALIIGCLTPMVSFAQSAAILPNARTQFINANGQPIVGGTVSFYIPSTLTSKTTWQDVGETTPNTNPITLDALGSALIWGSGEYREILKDAFGNIVWDGNTSGTNIGSANGILRGDGAGGISAVTLGSNLSLTGGPPGGVLGASYLAPYAGSVQETITASLQNVVNVTDFGAKCDGTTNDTTAIQYAINSGATLVNFPTGTCNFTTLSVLGGIRLEGANNPASGGQGTFLVSTDASSNDKIVIGNGSSELYGIAIEHMVINAPDTSGGAVVSFNYIGDSYMNDIQMISIGSAAYGVKLHQVNTLRLLGMRIINPITSGVYAYGSDSQRSDVIILRDFIVSGDSLSGAAHVPNCVDIDGFVNTVDGEQVLCVDAGRGLYAHNSVGTTQRAEYVFMSDMEVDFPYNEAVRIDYHDGVNFVNSYFHGSVTADDIFINTNTPNTVTNISFIGGQCTGAYKRCAYINGRYVRMIGVEASGNSQQGSADWPGVELGPNSTNVIITGDKIGSEDGVITASQSYGVETDVGSIYYILTDNDFLGNVTGTINEQSTDDASTSSSGIVQPNLGGIISTSNASIAATTGSTIVIGPGMGQYNVSNLNINATGTLSTLTVDLPVNPAQATIFRMFSNQIITTLTLTPGSGDTVETIPTAMAANGSFSYIYDQPNHNWVRTS